MYNIILATCVDISIFIHKDSLFEPCDWWSHLHRIWNLFDNANQNTL